MAPLHPRRCLAALLLWTGAGAHAEPLALDDALGIALANNTRVQNAELRVEAVADEVAALRAQRLPRVGLRGSYSDHLEQQDYTFDQGIWGDNSPVADVELRDVDDTTGRVSADLVQPLSQQYSLALGIEQGEVDQRVAEQTVKTVKLDLASLVRRQYFELLQNESNLRVTEQSLAFYRSLDELVSSYVEQEVALRYELLDVQARQARLEQQKQVQNNALTTGRQRMNRLLARDVDTAFSVMPLSSPALYTGTLEKAMTTALGQRPDLAGSRMKIQSAELGYDLKKAEYIPEVNLTLRYSRLYNHDVIPDEEAYVGIQANWEIIDWGRRRNELASQRTQLTIAQNQVASLEEKVRIDVSRAFLAAGDAQGFVEAADLSRAAAREKLRVLMNEYRQQSALLKDVLDAQTELQRAENEYVRAQLGVWKAQSELRRAMGDI